MNHPFKILNLDHVVITMHIQYRCSFLMFGLLCEMHRDQKQWVGIYGVQLYMPLMLLHKTMGWQQHLCCIQIFALWTVTFPFCETA